MGALPRAVKIGCLLAAVRPSVPRWIPIHFLPVRNGSLEGGSGSS
jgi:hypothetical protein